MNVSEPSPAQHDPRHAAAKRTALRLGVVALLVYGLFIALGALR